MFIQMVRLLVLISVLCMLSMSFFYLYEIIWWKVVLLYMYCCIPYVPASLTMLGVQWDHVCVVHGHNWTHMVRMGFPPPPPCSVPIVYDNYNGHIIWISTLSNLISSKYHYKKSKIGLLLLVRNKLVGKISSLVMAPCWKCQIVLQWLSEVS